MTRKQTGRPPKPRPGAAGSRSGGRLQRALDSAARHEIETALRETDGAVVAAARLLGISKVALWKRMKALGIGKPQ